MKYNHAYSLGFSVETDRKHDEPIDPQEVLAALLERIADVVKCGELGEAVGLPFDSYEVGQ